MKTGGKILLPVVVAVIVLLIVLLAVFMLFGERAVKIGVETAAGRALGVGVYVQDIDLSLLKGTVGITGLVVNNPPGYAHKNLLELDTGRVEAKVGSLLSDTVKIRQLKLDGVNLTIEQKVLSNNLQEVIGQLKAGEAAGEPAGKELHIDELEITNITVNAKLLPVPGKVDTVTLTLSPIRMKNLGTDERLGTAALSSKIMLAIAGGVAEQGVGVLPKEMLSTMKSTVDTAIGLGKAATKEAEKLLETGKEAGTEVIEGLKGLLKQKKEE